MTVVAVIDSGGGNIGSVRYALERLGARSVLTADPATIASADRVILPGVGAAAPAMARLRELDLVATIRRLQQPLLGICLGMQLLYESSEEGEVECLGLLPGRITKLPPGPGVRVPHMGWNLLQKHESNAGARLLAGIGERDQAYFVHSYAAPVTADTLASASYGRRFTAVAGRGRCFGAQFHPERSAAVGSRLLANFLALEA
ncbi:imidazole glycerol phosphate synthase subunit HisH [Lysobacter enzymogenes]|uniref:Imidazole glycerol phosphate synthase subunit HisH n=1 Tax=Lysobacter enzymogenes TaxID=69 RepID=A0A0S2DF93_LYSEN|nr:imidazole glycerol phosphate synthase subunit HisH [Lysobacter enzymogenes]ALN57252.1 imidazole glycerol phosphate synthase, glutamine amidotransferase subunit [Lysobacter enzymogenes]QCW25900.1 imidazole glycerol phosphate synthase subunit HisH [Lysobacter enzymogenes]QQP99543.1 imidazole glycerol phosphate synthase subunit HisH [Lysobacter enzymogenes]ROU05567.1 imidazole glycerol phosphate synthase subunit HisH [Lysobacter enzymogenes]UZW58990.1 imidazole glycerol phosphate synthase subu